MNEETKVTQENIDKNTDRAAVAQEELLEKATEEGSIYTHDTHLEDKMDQLLANQINGAAGDTRTGLDTESIPQQQLEVLEEIRDILSEAPGVSLVDDIATDTYITPIECVSDFSVFVSRLRIDHTVPNGINMWVVSDNLRKGAALNSVQIAEELINRKFI